MELVEIIRELNTLPRGSLVYKNIKGKEQPYLQWTEKGKTKSRYIKVDEREKIFADLKRRDFLKSEISRISEETFRGEEYLYVRDSGSQYYSRNEQPLISKKTYTNGFSVERNYINSKAYHDKFEKLPVSKRVYERLYTECGRLLNTVDGCEEEKMIAINARTGELVVDNLSRAGLSDHTCFTAEEYKYIKELSDTIIVIHNHSYNRPPSGRDIATYAENDNIKISLVVCHDGDVFAIVRAEREVADLYKMYYDELKAITDEVTAKTIATNRLEVLNKDNRLYEVRRL